MCGHLHLEIFMQSILRILKLNEVRTGNKEGRPWEMQDAECLLLRDTGEVDQVGVLQLPKGMRGQDAPAPGDYLGTFALRPDMASRRITAVLVGLTPYSVKAPTSPASSKQA
jgi:hypothetical protein